MANLVKEEIREEELVPKMLSEYWPDLIYTCSPNSGREDNVKPWYGFMYLNINKLPVENRVHGPAILRLSLGSIFVIDQKDAWKDYLPRRRSNHVEKVIEIPISDPNFDKYKPIINRRIKDWLRYAAKVLKS